MEGLGNILSSRVVRTAGSLFLLVLFSFPQAVRGEYGRMPVSSIDPEVISIDEEKFLGARIDGDYILIDGSGREFKLEEFFGRPLVLVLSYYSCDGSCPAVNMTLRDLTGKMTGPGTGKDFRILTLSFDKNDGLEEIKKFSEMTGLDRLSGDSWTVAVMKEKEEIKRLTDSLGYRFFWSMRDRTFIHPSVLVVLTPEGRVSRYLYAASIKERDLELAVREAAFGTTGRSKITDLSDLLLIACYSYNYKEGRYTINYPLFIAAGSLVIGVSLFLLTVTVFKNKKKARR